MFSNLFSITLPNIGKYFPGIHFPRNSLSPEFTFQKETTFQQTNGALVLIFIIVICFSFIIF